MNYVTRHKHWWADTLTASDRSLSLYRSICPLYKNCKVSTHSSVLLLTKDIPVKINTKYMTFKTINKYTDTNIKNSIIFLFSIHSIHYSSKALALCILIFLSHYHSTHTFYNYVGKWLLIQINTKKVHGLIYKYKTTNFLFLLSVSNLIGYS